MIWPGIESRAYGQGSRAGRLGRSPHVRMLAGRLGRLSFRQVTDAWFSLSLSLSQGLQAKPNRAATIRSRKELNKRASRTKKLWTRQVLTG
jgi:hypothetical protein